MHADTAPQGQGKLQLLPTLQLDVIALAAKGVSTEPDCGNAENQTPDRKRASHIRIQKLGQLK